MAALPSLKSRRMGLEAHQPKYCDLTKDMILQLWKVIKLEIIISFRNVGLHSAVHCLMTLNCIAANFVPYSTFCWKTVNLLPEPYVSACLL